MEETLALSTLIHAMTLSNLSVKWIQQSRSSRLPVSKKELSPCPIDAMLTVIDGRWKGTILWRLMDGPLRTSELRRSIPGITERMLIRHLQELTTDGILIRQEDVATSPHIRYSISEYGLTLVPVLEQICAWGRVRLARLSAEPIAAPSRPEHLK
jgi:DNA-binding HxlR family transcriptional regulator